jgi:hypothetical protein
MGVLQAVLVGGLVVASAGILGIARRLVSRYEPLESLVDEVPYGCIDCGMQVVDGEGRVIGTVLIPPPARN